MMAKKKNKRVVHEQFPWDRWFQRKSFRLVQGQDFNCEVHGMASQIRNKASQRGLKVSLRVADGTITVTNGGK